MPREVTSEGTGMAWRSGSQKGYHDGIVQSTGRAGRGSWHLTLPRGGGRADSARQKHVEKQKKWPERDGCSRSSAAGEGEDV